ILGPFDFHDLGPESSQPARGPRPGPHPAEINHANVFKGSRSKHGVILLLRPCPGKGAVSGFGDDARNPKVAECSPRTSNRCISLTLPVDPASCRSRASNLFQRLWHVIEFWA